MERTVIVGLGVTVLAVFWFPFLFLVFALTGAFRGWEVLAWATPAMAALALCLGIIALRRVHHSGTPGEQLALWNLFVAALWSALVTYVAVGNLLET